MRYAIVTLLVMTSIVTTVAVAQDGSGHVNPKSVIITPPQPVRTTAAPTIASPTVLRSTVLRPNLPQSKLRRR
jgi:hypothetical protein